MELVIISMVDARPEIFKIKNLQKERLYHIIEIS